MDPSRSPVRIAVECGVARVTIDNPPLNLLDVALMTSLDEAFDDLRDDPDVRVIVVESADPDFFIAHGDMSIVDDPASFAALPIAPEGDPAHNPMMRLNEKIRALPQITIGKLRGIARGGGSELFTALDLRFASAERGRLAQMEAPTGIVPGAGATAYLPHLVGRARALEVVLGAELVDAPTAAQWGWINRAIPDARLDDEVDDLARRIASLPDGVVDAAVEAIDASLRAVDEGLAVENERLGELFSKPEAGRLTRAALELGAQTRGGELELESVLRRLRR